MNILMFIPCYNCARQVKRVLLKIAASNLPCEIGKILIVDNASSDETVSLLKDELNKISNELQKKVLFVKNKANYGLGGSFKLAISFAQTNKFTHFLVFHGDDQAELKDAYEMIKYARENSMVDVILGSRFMIGAELDGYSKSRLWVNLFFNKIFSFALKMPIKDIGSGVNLYKLDALPLEQIPYFSDHLAFDLLLLFHFSSKKFRTCFLPTNWTEKDQISNAKNVRIALTILKMLWDFKRGKRLLNKTYDSQRSFREVKI